MRAYHVDKYYSEKDEIYYGVMPYSLKGTIYQYFGFNFKIFRFNISYYPWYDRFTGFLKWMRFTRFSENKANKLCEKLNKRR